MSDEQQNKTLPGNEPDIKGGWYQPSEPSLWQKPEDQDEDSQPFVLWKRMPAFPEDVTDEPEEQGLWHRPSPEDTVLTEGTEIIKGQPIVVEQEETPSEPSDGELSPEDMIAQILGTKPQSKASDESLAAPEDFQIPTKRPEDAEIPSPEDFDLSAIQRPEDVVESVESEEDLIEDMIEDTLDDMEDGDPFDADELSALEQMIEAESVIDEAGEDAQDALAEAARRASEDLGGSIGEATEAAQDEMPTDAASYAEQMLKQLEDENNATISLADEPDATSILDDDENSLMGGLFSGTASIDEKVNTADPAEYARQMLGELGDEGTGASDTFSTAPLPAQQQQTAYIDPQTREFGESFRNTQNQVATLTAMYNNEEMTYDEYQRLLYENMVQDENGVWWMIGASSDTWYRHNVQTNDWEEDYPPALQALEQYEQAANPQTGGYSSTSAPTAYDLPPIDGQQAPQAGDTRYDRFGVPVGTVPDPIDNNYTMVGDSAFKDQLTSQQNTLPSDGGGFEPTVVSPSVQGSQFAETMPMEARAQGFGNDALASPLDNSVPVDFAQVDDFAPTVDGIKKEQQSNLARTLIFATVGVVALGLIVVILGAIGIVLWYNSAVEPYREQIAALASYDPPFQTARILDANGDLIVELNSSETGARTAISLDEMSPFIIHAIVSQENERYYQDPGFDPIAIARAFVQNIVGGEIESGASTITQQIARNLVLQDTEVSSQRKVNEILVALEIANQYDKNFILELYLNEVFFGNQSYGVEAASQFYFGHGADELNFAEAALLTSIVPSPALNDPVVNRPTAISGMRDIMRKMLEVGCMQFQHGDWISRGAFCVTTDTKVNFEGDEVVLVRVNGQGEISGGLATLQIAEIETAEYQPRNVRLKYPHFVNFIQSEIEAEYGTNALFQRGFTIYTTLNPSVQETAQDTLTRQVEVLVDTGVNTGAVMVTDPNTGAIRAMVGSHDFSDDVAGQVNNALTFQQPGSSIKPIVYTAGLIGNQGSYLTPASILWDVSVTYDVGNGSTYTPVNFDRRFHGPTPLRFALQNSYNVAAVKAYAFSGNEKFLEIAQAMGLIFPESSQVGLASALGANEVRLFDMMQAYGIFANAGQKVELYAIERITETVEGTDVEVPRAPHPEPVQAISPQIAYIMQNILSDDNARAEQFGTNSNLTLARLGIPTQNRISAKTGTSNDSRDLWTMGFTRNVVVGVWLGTYDNSPTFGTTGFNSASPIWNAVLESALRGRTPPEFTNPGTITREICRTTGTLSYDACPQRTTDIFIQDKFPPPPDQGFVQNIAIDSWSGLRANEFCDDYVVQDTFADINDPSAVDWLNTTTAGRSYAQTVGLPIPLQAPPASACSQGQALPTVIVSAPNVNSNVQGQVPIRGQVQAQDFARYELAYASAVQPDTFFPITTSQTQVTTNGGDLGVWDTLQLVNGNYILRLTVLSNSGGRIVKDIPVLVDNPIPTATPIPLPTSTPLDSGNTSSSVTAGTAIPFPNATAGTGGD